jgi:hypothetical protein
MKSEDVVIVVPVYKTGLNDIESRVLGHCVHVLGRYNIVFVRPAGLDLTAYKTLVSKASGG